MSEVNLNNPTSVSTNRYVSATSEFLESSSLVAKFAFLLLVFFAFIILLRLCIALMAYMLTPGGSPKLIKGMVDAKQLIVISQDPSENSSKTIYRSVNGAEGIEFTWSVWIYVDDLTYNAGKYKCVFYKGNDFMGRAEGTGSAEDASLGLNFPNNAPGLYIAPNTNDLVIFMNTFNVINEEIVVNDIPLNKWVNVLIRCQNTTLDVYINGTITKSHKLHGVPKQNYGDVYVAINGGFSGYISNLWYYDYALGTTAIASLAAKGPDTTVKDSTALTLKDNDYLSLRWFFTGQGEMP